MAQLLIRAAVKHLGRIAVATEGGNHTYASILQSSLNLAQTINSGASSSSLKVDRTNGLEAQPRVALMCSPGPEYVAATFATWLSKGIAVPLCLNHPDKELQYVLEFAECSSIVATSQHVERMQHLASPFDAAVHTVPLSPDNNNKINDFEAETTPLLNNISPSDGALIVMTSGTTGRPKGAVHTHSSVAGMINTLVQAWEWSKDDRIFHALPLHHVHGIVNALYCSLAVGATAEMYSKFSPTAAWNAFMRPPSDPEKVTVFMGVPTMYSFLLDHVEHKMDETTKTQAAEGASRLRLAVSGSAAAPIPILQRWKDLSGTFALERYGLTETGMILGNPMHGERRPGTVGVPFPNVDIKIVPLEQEESNAIDQPKGSIESSTVVGELRVKSPQLFAGYWRNQKATTESFDEEGYFKTGDTATWEGYPPYIKLLGRTSVDIIKRGGYKISALFIESALLSHPNIDECAVFGIPDTVYGEEIVAVIALDSNTTEMIFLEEFQDWAEEVLPKYQVPTEVLIVDSIPRNAMGKVNKKSLKDELYPDGQHIKR